MKSFSFYAILRLTIFWQWRKHADAAFKRVHTLLVFVCAWAVCAISLGARDLALRLAIKRTTSLPEDSETEYIIHEHLTKFLNVKVVKHEKHAIIEDLAK